MPSQQSHWYSKWVKSATSVKTLQWWFLCLPYEPNPKAHYSKKECTWFKTNKTKPKPILFPENSVTEEDLGCNALYTLKMSYSPQLFQSGACKSMRSGSVELNSVGGIQPLLRTLLCLTFMFHSFIAAYFTCPVKNEVVSFHYICLFTHQ